MKYGCIGEHLKHSFSKEIHNLLADYDYEILEIEKECLEKFAKEKNFNAINVTIPYKELIMPYIYSIDEYAKKIGSVNTVVNRGGKLYGYNTDFFGMCKLIEHAGIKITDKKVVILGTGGTSKTAYAVSAHLGAKEIIITSRKKSETSIDYTELYEKHTDAEIIINTTPVGMFPSIFESPVDVSKFDKLSGVIDAVYNPLCTELISSAKEKGIPAEGGLYMLVAQAVRASEIFIDTKYDTETTDKVYKKILSDKENIVLIGMPASGKTTVGKILAQKLGRKFIDTDALIEEKAKKSIPEIFKTEGESRFRDLEAEVIKEVSSLTCSVIATGGGSVLRNENVFNLKKNGKIYFIDRPLDALIPTSDRPLGSTKEAIEKRYIERYDIYMKSANVRIDADTEANEVSEKILGDFLK